MAPRNDSREHLASIIDTVADPIFVKDREHRWVLFNKAFCDFMGRRPDEIQDKSDYQFFPKKEADIFWAKDEEVFRSGVENVNEEFFTDSKGVRKTITTKKTLYKDQEGKEYIVGVIRDITEYQQAQENLAASKAKLNLALKSSQMGMWQYNLLENKRYFDDQACALLGIDPGKFLGTYDEFLTVVHPGDHLKVKTALENTIRQGLPYEPEYRVVWPDGSIRHISARGELVRDEQGVAKMIIGIITDITKQYRLADELRRSQLLLEGILNAISVRVFWKDRDLTYLGCNAVFARDAGFSDPKELIGKNDHQLVWREQAELYRNDDRQVIESGRPKFLLEEPQKTPTGETIVLLTSKIPLLDTDGKTIGVLGTYVDITERKKQEEELKLAQRMLVQSEKLASLGRLVSEIAHEVNNPLMIISGNAELSMMSESLPDDVQNSLRVISDECQRAKMIIHRLLKFSKPSRGAIKQVNINESIEKIAVMVEHQYHLANVQIHRYYMSDPPPLFVDEQQMQEVFMNLINNAKEAMPNGGSITIKTLVENGQMRIEFTDTGPGMREEVQKNIFDPFFTTKEMGTGLGLPVCYGIVKAHHGDIKLESAPMKGTTAIILLPLEGPKADV